MLKPIPNPDAKTDPQPNPDADTQHNPDASAAAHEYDHAMVWILSCCCMSNAPLIATTCMQTQATAHSYDSQIDADT
jgi:hypothetical protein